VERLSSPEPGRRWGFRRPRRLRTIALLPTLITLGNGVCGVMAIFKIGLGMTEHNENHFRAAGWLILGAMVFDALDGFVARMTRTTSNFGAMLDSLCDLVTFGVAPGFLVFGVTRAAGGPELVREHVIPAVGVLYAMCALIRLARFTVETTPDESSHREFAGLPSPAAAGIVAGAVLASLYPPFRELGVAPAISGAIPGLALATAILMVSRVKYAHVINKLLRGKHRFVTLVEIALAVTLAVIFREAAFFLAFFVYGVTGPLLWLKRRVSRKPGTAPAASPPSPATAKNDKNLF
jgi:CDP-diacylglycerol--serine O-phosphatidyltransferase